MFSPQLIRFVIFFRQNLFDNISICLSSGFPGGSVGQKKKKKSACNAGGPGSIPGSGRSPGEGNGNPLQYSCLENPMDRGAWQATAHGDRRVGHNLATKTTLSEFTYPQHCVLSRQGSPIEEVLGLRSSAKCLIQLTPTVPQRLLTLPY